MQNIKLNFINPITEQEDVLNINYEIDYCFWKSSIDWFNEFDLIKHLNYLLKCIDCTIIYDCGANCVINSHLYEIRIKEYMYYLLKISNVFIYNEYLDKLLQQHIKNISFDYEFHNQFNQPKKKNTKKKIKNEFIRQETTDLFTNETIYEYVNHKTNEVIRSNNPNLLYELNNKKKKENKSKVIPMLNITFNFKKNKT